MNVESIDWLDTSARSDYGRFLNENGNDDHIRKATSRGRPCGGAIFLEILERQLGRSLRPNKCGRPSKEK